jgi:hypothetical protein
MRRDPRKTNRGRLLKPNKVEQELSTAEQVVPKKEPVSPEITVTFQVKASLPAVGLVLLILLDDVTDSCRKKYGASRANGRLELRSRWMNAKQRPR